MNPDRLSTANLSKQSKGVKNKPLSNLQQIQKGVDATHADINLGQFFKKLIVREIAGVTSWELTSDIKDLVRGAEHRFDAFLKAKCGLNPQLMMPGNYARTLFECPSSVLLELVTNNDKKEKLTQVLDTFKNLKSVYRCINPLRDMPEKVTDYKQKAVEMGILLIENFDYASWPNYLHKIVEHVQQLIVDPRGPGSIGAFASEGNECCSAIFVRI